MEAQPYKICTDSVVGRHLVAVRPIEAGTIILKESPLVRGPFLHTIPVCLSCGKILGEKNWPCTKCGWPLCGENCENSENHEPECLLTQNKGSKISIKNFGIANPNYQFVSILRTLFLKKSSPETWEKLMGLQSHSIDVNLVPPSFLHKLFKLADWSEDEIKKVSEILTVNGHELPLTQPSQLVVYDNVSFLEHSCKANCTKTFTNDGDVLVVAAEAIPEGAHLSICYTDPLWGLENRRKHLHQTKKFWCCCQRCEDPSEFGTHLNSIKCPHRPCQGLLLPKTFLQEPKIWTCDQCDSIFPDDNVALLLGKIGLEVTELPKGDGKVCKQFVKKYERILAPNHFYLIDVKMALSHMLANENIEELSGADLKLLLKMTEELKIVAEKVAPSERRLLGLLMYRVAKSRIEVARRGEDQKEFRSALVESKELFSQACLLLINEPSLLPEGRLHLQIGLESKLIDTLLNCT